MAALAGSVVSGREIIVAASCTTQATRERGAHLKNETRTRSAPSRRK